MIAVNVCGHGTKRVAQLVQSIEEKRGNPMIGRITQSLSLHRRPYSLLAVVILLHPMSTVAMAQEHGLEFRGTIGYAKHYLDEPGDLLIAGSFRFDLTERYGLEPEVSWIRGNRFEERAIGLYLVYNLADRGSKLIPYAIIGGGLNNELDKSINYKRWHGYFNGGFGLKHSCPN